MRVSRVMLLLLLFAVAAVCAAQSGGPYEIRKSSIDAGGTRSTGGPMELNGTIGQPDASLQSTTGGNYSLTGGFWARGEVVPPPPGTIFANGFES